MEWNRPEFKSLSSELIGEIQLKTRADTTAPLPEQVKGKGLRVNTKCWADGEQHGSSAAGGRRANWYRPFGKLKLSSKRKHTSQRGPEASLLCGPPTEWGACGHQRHVKYAHGNSVPNSPAPGRTQMSNSRKVGKHVMVRLYKKATATKCNK